MSEIIFGPIDIGAPQPRCCLDSLDGRTEAYLTGDAEILGANKWRLFNTQATGTIVSNPNAEEAAQVGQVTFGVCCATEIVLTLEGNIEDDQRAGGYDSIEVKLNGVQEYYQASLPGSGAPWDTKAVAPFDVTINLTPQPCGNIIEIIGDNVDNQSNNGVWWTAEVKSIS